MLRNLGQCFCIEEDGNAEGNLRHEIFLMDAMQHQLSKSDNFFSKLVELEGQKKKMKS